MLLLQFLSCFRRPKPLEVEQRVLALVRHAWDHVPFYRAKMEQHGLTPDDFRSLRDYVEKFPRTRSAEYRAFQAANGSRGLLDTRLAREKLLEDRSSGSSGIFVSLYRTLHELHVDKARALWFMVRAGLRPWHRILAVLPPTKMVKRDSFLQLFGIFRRTTVNYTMPVEEVVRIIRERRIDAIYGHKSFIRLIADHYAATGTEAPRLKLLIPGAEMIFEADRRCFQQVFRPELYREFYGSTETYFIAARHEGDYEPDYKAVFFCLDAPAGDGELTRGAIVATSLVNEAQPILQLELGDRVAVRNYDRLYELESTIAEVEGRNNDYVVLGGGEKVSCATFRVVLDRYPFVHQFRILQDSEQSCAVLLRTGEASPAERLEMESSVKALVRGRIRCEVRYVDEIPIDANGKTKELVSRIDRQPLAEAAHEAVV